MPGDPLGVAEELIPGWGVYVDKDGVLRAAVKGRAVIDRAAKFVYVNPYRKPRFPEPSSEVVGYVTGLRHDLVILDIYGVVSLTPRPRWLYETSGPLSGGIPIANIADEFIKDITEYFRLGDVVVAKIVSRTHPFTLTTKAPQYGVLYAYCGKCGSIMSYKSDRLMVCPRCGNVEKRKVSLLARSKQLMINVRRHLIRYRYPW
jgi:exosome complex component CSL4